MVFEYLAVRLLQAVVIIACLGWYIGFHRPVVFITSLRSALADQY